LARKKLCNEQSLAATVRPREGSVGGGESFGEPSLPDQALGQRTQEFWIT